MGILQLQNNKYEVVVRDEDPYSSQTSNFTQAYEYDYYVGKTSEDGLYVEYRYEMSVCESAAPPHYCLLRTSVPSSLQDNSALLYKDHCIVAIGSALVTLTLPDLSILWQAEVDLASCFGVYHAPKYESFISHGECEIARVSYTGDLVWRSSGKDIFTNGFALLADHIEAVDFNNEVYHIDLATGRSTLIGIKRPG